MDRGLSPIEAQHQGAVRGKIEMKIDRLKTLDNLKEGAASFLR